LLKTSSILGFEDVANSDEMYEYLNLVFVGQIGLEEGTIGGTVADNNMLVGGIRFRQLRVGENSCRR
jgi:hypothetical protein